MAMITLRITSDTLCDDKIALEKKKRNDTVHISSMIAMHRLNIKGFAGSVFTTSDKIIQYQNNQGNALACIHIEYDLESGIHAISTWVKGNREIREIYNLKTSIALALRSHCPAYIEKHLLARIKEKEVIKVNKKYMFKDPLLYRLDMISNSELKDLLVEHSLLEDTANVELIKTELRQRDWEGKYALPRPEGQYNGQ